MKQKHQQEESTVLLLGKQTCLAQQSIRTIILLASEQDRLKKNKKKKTRVARNNKIINGQPGRDEDKRLEMLTRTQSISQMTLGSLTKISMNKLIFKKTSCSCIMVSTETAKNNSYNRNQKLHIYLVQQHA